MLTPLAWIGWANALAAGTMLGAAYLLLDANPEPWAKALGATAGIFFVAMANPAGAGRVLVRGSLHAACEGVALGAAFALAPPFGLFLAAALAAHNVAEVTVLAAGLCAQGLRLPRAVALAAVAKAPQAVLAVVTFGLVRAVPAALPWVAGFGVGALVNLVLIEPLPAAYHQASRVRIALAAAAALVAVVLLSGVSR